ncbi:RnfH family protein [Herbaspirillum sp. GCM10030257]|uniref:RnfH family protein n=1 Tax=Herbaspirillum sp. GCM10030257 TaxID=3273393 RepID=UPI00360FCF03
MADLRIQVCYAKPEWQFLRELSVVPGTTIRDAIQVSGLLEEAPEIDLSTARVGVYGKLKELDALLREHDRVEVYRPLIADPKDARRRRAIKKERQK